MASKITRVVSGIQPTGIPHIGNYLGTLQSWVNLQKDNVNKTSAIISRDSLQNAKPKSTTENHLKNFQNDFSKNSNISDKKLFYFLADLHSLTTLKPNLNIKQASFTSAAIILACGLDPQTCVFFKQSAVPSHSELMWLLSCITPMGQLNRMTSWKSKISSAAEVKPDASNVTELNSSNNIDSITGYSGLFMYPVLQAADILLYRPSHVPVGEDQSQHLELTRDLAQTFNKKTKSSFFLLPQTLLTNTKRVMSLKDPTKKMSKSDSNPKATILLTDSANEIKSKIMKAVTDSTAEIFYDPVNRPGISNLLEIYSALNNNGTSPEDACNTVFRGLNSQSLKTAVTDVLIQRLLPIQNEYHRLIRDPEYINQILDDGAEQANTFAKHFPTNGLKGDTPNQRLSREFHRPQNYGLDSKQTFSHDERSHSTSDTNIFSILHISSIRKLIFIASEQLYVYDQAASSKKDFLLRGVIKYDAVAQTAHFSPLKGSGSKNMVFEKAEKFYSELDKTIAVTDETETFTKLLSVPKHYLEADNVDEEFNLYFDSQDKIINLDYAAEPQVPPTFSTSVTFNKIHQGPSPKLQKPVFIDSKTGKPEVEENQSLISKYWYILVLATYFDMIDEIRVLLLGEDGTGKSSLITSFIKEEFLTNVQKTVPEVTIPPEVTSENITTHIVDTGIEHRDRLEAEILKANVICLIYSIVDRESFERINSIWLPLLRSKGINVPVILVGNQIDRKSEVKSEYLVDSSEVLPLMRDYKEIETCIECSAKNLTNVTELFYFAQKAVLHPVRILYDTSTRTLKHGCISALARIFWLCDKDGDGILNYAELNEFQKTCFLSSLNETELADILSVVRNSLPEGVRENGLNFEGFIQLHKLFIQQGRVETTWIVLRKFNYGDDLKIKEELLYPDIQVDNDCSVELSAEGFAFITQLFRRFDRDQDAALNNIELNKLFSVIPYDNPWIEYDFPNCTVTNNSGNVTLQGWLAMWSMVTLLDCRFTLELFGFLGYPEDTLNGITVVKKNFSQAKIKKTNFDNNSNIHQLDHSSRNINYSNDFSRSANMSSDNNRSANMLSNNSRNTNLSQNSLNLFKNKNILSRKLKSSKTNSFRMFSKNKSQRSTSLVYLVGSQGCGKSSLIKSFVRKIFDSKYTPTQTPLASVNSVEIKAEQHYLVIKEFGLYTNMALSNTSILDSCDLLCMVYDSSDPNSFQYLLDLRSHYDLNGLPTMFIATKSDLDTIAQSSTIQPDIYCKSLKLPAPIFISVKTNRIANIFEKIAALMSKPKTVIPSLLLTKKGPTALLNIFKYSAVTSIHGFYFIQTP
ncbi:hypothetical protein BB561_002543 [Smittium simulii]|uniref:Mitochondrial Rho GTPase 1 n=1 Tax=Smittium simulii TaxID=133385 RepID=A0A2T9YQ43_9FUNG|nr:hypothetical protein BB561_002543 [Smittium simulii]